MKEFIKIGDHYVKDAQAREDIEAMKEQMEKVEESIGNLSAPSNPLPTVDETDNGKVLQVVNGIWTKTTPVDPATETWTFNLDDGSTVIKKVCVG